MANITTLEVGHLGLQNTLGVNVSDINANMFDGLSDAQGVLLA